MTSQGPINLHAFENLTPSDEGVRLYRDFLREQIEAVQAGRHPLGVAFDGATRIRTRTQNTVVRAPARTSDAEETSLLRQLGRDVAEGDYRQRWSPA